MPGSSSHGWKNFVLISEHLVITHLQEKPLPFLSGKGVNMDVLDFFRGAYILIVFHNLILLDLKKKITIKKGCNFYLKRTQVFTVNKDETFTAY